MTFYSTSNKSIEDVDPLKQAGQLPSYSIQPDSTEYQQPQPQSQDRHVSSTTKPTAGEKFHKISSKAGSPLNKAANLFGAEGWWPSTMDKECSKAARILHSFTRPLHPTGLTRKSMVKIPPSVLQSAAGLAIFNSPPSSFIVSSLGAGFVFGLDVYDCVCVLNTPEQVAAFTKPRLSFGAEGSVALGPIGTGGSVEAALSKTARPVWSYMKSRGLWMGVQIDGTIVVTRGDANDTFYNERGITAGNILCGDVAWPMAGKPLFEVLQALEGRTDYNQTVVQAVGQVPPPGDGILSEKQERYTDEPQAQETREKTQPEITPSDVKEDLPDYEVVKKDDEEKIVDDEKARLAASGY
ncbi:hypothetical protein FCIRC_6089 [Fusarium circinatum]|uniref:Ysc84 actin-binding domain-containing protein n=1 Tax=Fusarium circinatum TaxID=48490 RepID=A0A8H5U077_FUSCI|nr:hypothetical protein FCIRC_6089 [Fusarium circinatum]